MSTEDIREDYLSVDKDLPGQKYTCVSFISPESVIEDRNTFFFRHYLQYKYKDEAETITEDYKDFLYTNQEKLQDEYDKTHDFRTSVRGVKVRGVFNTLREAQIRAKVLQQMDDIHHIYIGQVGFWLPWDPNADLVEGQEYKDKDLNKLMKQYKENRENRDQQYMEDVREKKRKIVEDNEQKLQTNKDNQSIIKEGVETQENIEKELQKEDPWMQQKGSATSTDTTTTTDETTTTTDETTTTTDETSGLVSGTISTDCCDTTTTTTTDCCDTTTTTTTATTTDCCDTTTGCCDTTTDCCDTTTDCCDTTTTTTEEQ